MDANHFLEQQLDRRWIAELALNEDTSPGIEMVGARHAQVGGNETLRPHVDFAQAGIMKAPEACQERLKVLGCL